MKCPFFTHCPEVPRKIRLGADRIVVLLVTFSALPARQLPAHPQVRQY